MDFIMLAAIAAFFSAAACYIEVCRKLMNGGTEK